MKKILLLVVVIILSVLIIATTVVFVNRPRDAKISVEDKKIYDQLVNKLRDYEVESFQSGSTYFTIHTHVEAVEDGMYRYLIKIDNPLVGMFDVGAVAVDMNEENILNKDAYRHSFGVIGNHIYHLIPGQVDIEKGYVRDFELELFSNETSIDVLLFVQWKNELGDLTFNQFIKVNITNE